MKDPTVGAVAVAASLAIALAAPVAHAQHDEAAAAAAYDRGVAALRTNRYGDAILALEDSYRIAPVPGVLFNLAIAYRGAGRKLAALNTFTRYLREEGAAVPPERRAAVERAIGELRVDLGTVECQVTPPSATVTIDGRPVSCGAEILVDPGEHILEARADGYALARRTLRLEAGGRESFRAELTPTERPREVVTPPPRVLVATPHPRQPVTPVERPVYTRWWFWTAVGVVVAAAGTATAVYFATRDPAYPQLDTLFNVEALHVH